MEGATPFVEQYSLDSWPFFSLFKSTSKYFQSEGTTGKVLKSAYAVTKRRTYMCEKAMKGKCGNGFKVLPE